MASLKILSMNCNSIIGKIDTIRAHVQTYKPDLVSITETKIDARFQDNELLGENFTIWRKDRKQGAGGVLVAVCNDSNVSILNSVAGPGESICLSIQIHPHIKFCAVTMYRPPNEYDIDNFEYLINEYKHENCVFVGDYNFADLDWISNPNQCHVKPHSARKAIHEKALDIIDNADLLQLVHEPTHKQGNTLDLVLVNKAALDDVYISCEVLPYISDHKMIMTTIQPQSFPDKQSTIPGTKTPRYNFRKANYADIENLFSKLLHNLENSAEPVEPTWHKIENTIKQALDSIPGKLSRPKGHPWVDRDIVRMIRRRDRMFKRNCRFPSIAHELEYDNLCLELKKRIRSAKTHYLKHLSDQLESGNSKPLYNYLQRNSGRSNKITGLADTETSDIANKFADHFASVFTKSNHPIPNSSDSLYPKMRDIHVSKAGVKALLEKLDHRKAGGPDNISAMIIKQFTLNVPSFVECIYLLIKKSIDTGVVPHVWKKANVSPIFKGGDRADVNNYRPISLTCILSKVTEHIICSNLWDHLLDNSILTEKQHGFRKGLNTTTQLLHVIHFAAQSLDLKEQYHIVSFDFSKAFDRVPHDLLIHKLKYYNVSDVCTEWISNWLQDRTSVVQTNGQRSDGFDVRSGVPQGSVLGPLLFLIYINDMTDLIHDSDIRLYADDTLLCVNLTKCPNILQSEVTKLYDWANKWGMLFNAKKCVHIQVGKSEPDIRVKLGDSLIPSSDSFRYLGVQIDSSLKWKTHITNIVAKANRTLGMVKRGLRHATVKSKLVAYKTVVKPLLEYASQVWSPHNVYLKTNIERVQRDAVKWIYFLKHRESITDCMSKNNISLLSDRRDELDTLFLRKVEAGLYEVKLNSYIRFNHTHDTRGKSISWHYNVNPWKYSFYNRVRDQVKVYFPPD